MTDRDELLARLRHGQAAVVQSAVPDLASTGARATPRDGDLLGGRVVSQRVQVELPGGGVFDAAAVLDAAVAVWRPASAEEIEGLAKQDGTGRVDLLGEDEAYHSVTFLHGGRVLQITSFTPLPDAAPGLDEAEDDPRRLALDAEEAAFGPDYGYALTAG